MTSRPALVAVLTLLMISGAVPASATDDPPHPTGTDATGPPMGWNTWNAYRCDIDQDKVRRAADALVRTGLAAKGYRQVTVDDCWQAPRRTPDGMLQADPKRFPDGMAALAEYVHARGLRFGIYATPGTKTCAQIYDGYRGAGLGSLGHERDDARTFATWGVDYVKYDWCRADRDGVAGRQAYRLMRRELDNTGRQIALGAHYEPQTPIPAWAGDVAQTWRTTKDIRDRWPSMIDIARRTLDHAHWNRPGRWVDPDMLEVGNGGMCTEEYRTHLSLWAQLGAPLMIGTDLDRADSTTVELLGRSDVIAIDQDPLAAAPTVVWDRDNHLITSRPLSGGALSVTLTNRWAVPSRVRTSIAGLGLPAGTYRLTDVWTGHSMTTEDVIGTSDTPGHGTTMYRVERVLPRGTPSSS
ncbi:Alpha-galactosidase A [Austwickia sp. TVS 96-490-7B]|uniref:glycoside hydrolase family 27 protein n=1 Tax=Austwickia sp. TVS 96-490-7B TaxID=2830843 RepID=UPI001C59F2CB|nr:glycoside hydrolase family 27 protein [Austwickia sp. TVS 96-490-7B]MBW3083891.1 Alpha-galactosidase A [Austwickia sp. TVS 96-490-7B]